MSISEWVELSGKGQLISWSILHYPNATAPTLTPPYVLAYVKLDGADTLFAHVLQNVADLSKLQYGASVHIVYPDEAVAHPLLLIAFQLSKVTA